MREALRASVDKSPRSGSSTTSEFTTDWEGGTNLTDQGTATCDGTQCGFTCAEGFHACGELCVDNADVVTCGTSCEPCPTPLGGTATCDGSTCGGTCPAGQTLCAGTCINQNQACSGACPAGSHDCNGSCLPDTSPNSCGTSCTPCRVPPNSDPTCGGGACDFVCRTGFHRCGTGCASDSDASACGTSCTPCGAPAGGFATCAGGNCGQGCPTGTHLCGNARVPNNSPNGCGSSCAACTAPIGGSATCVNSPRTARRNATCTDGACGVSCASGAPCGKYPELFRSLARFAELGQSVIADLSFEGDYAFYEEAIATYFESLRRITTILAEMAELQRTGQPHSPEHVDFINQAIRIEGGGSGDPWQTGWYKDLFFGATGLEYDPTIADVHTDPGGVAPIARGASVLHVGTGMPRPMIVNVDTCEGPRAYAGVVFAYHEHTEPGLNRLTDVEWAEKLRAQPAPDVPWLAPVLAGP